MKRTTKGAMGYIACSDVALPLMPHVAEDILDSHAALKAEVRRKDVALRQIQSLHDAGSLTCDIATAALKPRRTR